MTLTEIKAAVAAGKTVCVGTTNYKVTGSDPDDLLITCLSNGYCIGLTHRDGVTLNAEPEDFFLFPRPWPA